MKGATNFASISWSRSLFQSTLPMKGATLVIKNTTYDLDISIHAPNEGSDLCMSESFQDVKRISIHAPNEGSDINKLADEKTEIISIHAPNEGSDDVII